jgi:hypothetical protein
MRSPRARMLRTDYLQRPTYPAPLKVERQE